MATPAAPSPRPMHSNLVRIIAGVLLGLIILVGLAVLIIWLAVRPRHLVYTFEDGSIHGFNLSRNHLNANFKFVLRVYNPNTKVSIYYDKMVVTVLYNDETLAFNTVDPFFQPHKNVTRLGLSLTAKDVALFGSVGRDLRLEKSSGSVELEVKVRARIRLKVGVWKSRHRTLKIACSPVLVHLSSSPMGFERTSCDVDL